jgi:hypothetical protein
MTTATAERADTQIHRDLERGELQAVEGVLQRVNYRTGEFKLVTAGKVWHFKLTADCKLYFDDKQAILRCFHPLDPVRVVFEPGDSNQRARALYAWERVYSWN